MCSRRKRRQRCKFGVIYARLGITAVGAFYRARPGFNRPDGSFRGTGRPSTGWEQGVRRGGRTLFAGTKHGLFRVAWHSAFGRLSRPIAGRDSRAYASMSWLRGTRDRRCSCVRNVASRCWTRRLISHSSTRLDITRAKTLRLMQATPSSFPRAIGAGQIGERNLYAADHPGAHRTPRMRSRREFPWRPLYAKWQVRRAGETCADRVAGVTPVWARGPGRRATVAIPPAFPAGRRNEVHFERGAAPGSTARPYGIHSNKKMLRAMMVRAGPHH